LSFEQLNGPFRDGGLLLRPLVARDAGELYMLVDAHPRELARWLPWVTATRAVADSSYYIMSLTGFWKSGLAYGVFENGQLVGTVGFQHGDERNQTVEIGYWLGTPFQGKGLATRALRLALKAGFEHTAVHRVAARVQLDNRPSIALLEKLGFQFEGVERQGIKFGDGRPDHRVYSLLRPEFVGKA
jgi:ribosomal-protein-serine acetyltransferase